jgi:hypothetical protein
MCAVEPKQCFGTLPNAQPLRSIISVTLAIFRSNLSQGSGNSAIPTGLRFSLSPNRSLERAKEEIKLQDGPLVERVGNLKQRS